MDAHEIFRERALVAMGAWGSGERAEAWEGYAAAVTDYAPEWCEWADGLCGAVTVFDPSGAFGTPKVPEGYCIAGMYNAASECPCVGGDEDTEVCPLCEGEGYCCDECDKVIVFVPRYQLRTAPVGGYLPQIEGDYTDLTDARDAALESILRWRDCGERVRVVTPGACWESDGVMLTLEDVCDENGWHIAAC